MTDAIADKPVPGRTSGADRRSGTRSRIRQDAVVLSGEDMTVEWRRGADVEALVPAWRSLAARTGEPNIFQDPDFLLPSAKALGYDREIEALAVWEGQPADPRRPRLLGVLPFVRRRPWGVPITVAQSVCNAYGPSGTPVVETEAGLSVTDALIDAFATTPELPRLLLVPMFALDSAPAKAIGQRPAPKVHLGGHLRAVLKTELTGEAYVTRMRRPKQRKRLAQQRRQLEKLGEVTTRVNTGLAVGQAADRFLELEKSGWKGRRGTAMGVNEASRAMFRDLSTRLGRREQCEIHELCLDGRTIAAFVLLLAGPRGWLWKGAYDEAYARYSPGQLLTVDLIREVLDSHPGIFIDSCATPDHPMIDHVFRERLALADVLIDTRPETGHAFAIAVMLETWRRDGRRRAREALNRVRALMKKLKLARARPGG